MIAVRLMGAHVALTLPSAGASSEADAPPPSLRAVPLHAHHALLIYIVLGHDTRTIGGEGASIAAVRIIEAARSPTRGTP